MADPQFDKAKAKAFSHKMLGILNDASLAQMIVIGHQVGLFDTLAGLAPSTSEQIAAASALKRTLRARVARRDGDRPDCGL